MSKPIKNLVNQRFGDLTVIKQDNYYESPNGIRKVKWLCRCKCGNLISVIASDLTRGHTTSCGCKKVTRLKKYNTYNFFDTYVIGFSSNSDDEFLLSSSDYEKIKDYCWIKHHSGYMMAVDTISDKLIYLHVLIMQPINDEEVDHINGNKLDNRRENLRICTHQQNMMNRKIQKNNTSGIPGVYYNKKYSKWHARIKINGFYIHLGFFDDINEAAQVRQNAEQQYFKEIERNNKEQ